MSLNRNVSLYHIPASLLVNLLLAALILKAEHQHPLAPVFPVLSLVSQPHFTPVQYSPLISPPAVSKPEPQQGLSWEKLKSSDIREFVANLRRVGAPDQVVEYLALAAWDAHVKAQTGSNQKPDVWVISQKAAQLRAEHSEFRKHLKSEGQNLFKELFGYVPDRDFKRQMNPEMLFVLGFIPDPTLERLFTDPEVMELDQRMAGNNSPQEMVGMYKKFMELAALQLAPSEVEEARLRFFMSRVSKMSDELSAIGLSGYQSHEVLKALFQSGNDPIEKLLGSDGSGGPLVDLDPALIGHFLTPTQLSKLQRMADPQLNQAFLFTESQGLPAETAVQLHQITLATKMEMDSIKDKYLLAENRKKAQADIQRITMETLQKIIPPDKMSTLQKQFLTQSVQ